MVSKKEGKNHMAYSFTVQRAATIQCLCYKSLNAYKKDLQRRDKKGLKYEVLHEETGKNGTYLVTMKIPVMDYEMVGYNDFNKFM